MEANGIQNVLDTFELRYERRDNLLLHNRSRAITFVKIVISHDDV
jgi:hypothetical protein